MNHNNAALRQQEEQPRPPAPTGTHIHTPRTIGVGLTFVVIHALGPV